MFITNEVISIQRSSPLLVTLQPNVHSIIGSISGRLLSAALSWFFQWKWYRNTSLLTQFLFLGRARNRMALNCGCAQTVTHDSEASCDMERYRDAAGSYWPIFLAFFFRFAQTQTTKPKPTQDKTSELLDIYISAH